jgi:hypothetical protein
MRVKILRAAAIAQLPPQHKVSVRWHCLRLAGGKPSTYSAIVAEPPRCSAATARASRDPGAGILGVVMGQPSRDGPRLTLAQCSA